MFRLSLAFTLTLSLILGMACSDDTDSNNTTKKDGGAIKKDVGATKQDKGAVTPDKGTPDTGTTKQDKGAPDMATTTPDSGSKNCTGCHGYPPSVGKHTKHIAKGMKCFNCHGDTMDSSNNVKVGGKHKNGSKDVKGTFTWDSTARTCANTGCHSTKSW